MRNLNLLAIATIISATVPLFSCINENSDGPCPSNDQTIRLYVKSVETRTTEDNGNNGRIHTSNTVGAFVVAAGLSEGDKVSNGLNNQHSVDNSGNLIPEKDKDIIVPEGTTEVSIYAYAPHNESWKSYEAYHTFTVSTDQSDPSEYLKSDLIAANGYIAEVKKNQEAIGLQFEHMMSRVILNISCENVLLKDASVLVNNTMVSTTFNPSEQSLSEASGEVEDIIAVSELENEKTAYAIIVPQTLGASTTLFSIVLKDITYKLKLSEETIFESGKSYTYNIKITPDTPENIEISLGGTTVKPWVEEEEKADKDAEGEYLVKNIELSKNNIRSGSNYIWEYSDKRFSWWYGSKDFPIIAARTDLTTDEYKIFNSLVIKISDYYEPENILSSISGAVLKTHSEGIFRKSSTEPLIISEDGTYVVDLTKFNNKNLFDTSSGLSLSGYNPPVNSENAARVYEFVIDAIYFTTQKASKILEEQSAD